MKKYILVLAIVLLSQNQSRADLDITLTDNGVGGITMVLFGSGTAGGAGDLISYGTLTDTFLNNGTLTQQSSASPNISFGSGSGQGSSAIAKFDRNGTFGGVQSVFQLNFVTNIPAASNLSDLNGTYDVPAITFSDFNLGVYSLVSESGNSAFIQNVGAVTLTVSNGVPEPTAASLFVVAGTCGLLRRRRNPAA